MRKVLSMILLLTTCTAWSQTNDPRVINSAGSHRVNSATGISITDNVGEPFSQTLGPVNSIMITEGYLQPLAINPGFSVTLAKGDVTCSDKKDGSLNIEIKSVYTQTAAAYSWTPDICPGNNCSGSNSLVSGNYSVAVRITYTTTGGFVRRDSSFRSVTITDAAGPCLITIYSGFSPNDAATDKWKIGNITEFPNNKVSIFNRWGTEVFSVKGYDNINNAWSAADEKLLSSTYFYIIDLGNGSKPLKGWVELMKK